MISFSSLYIKDLERGGKIGENFEFESFSFEVSFL